MVQPQTTTIPNNGSGTINIHINNPTAGVGSGMPQYAMPCAYPVYYPYFAYPPNYYMGNMGGINQSVNVSGGYPAGYPYGYGANAANNNSNNDNINKRNVSEINSNASENKKQREIVVLTDNYIKNL